VAAAALLTAAVALSTAGPAASADTGQIWVVPPGLSQCPTAPDLDPAPAPGPATDPTVPHCLGPKGLSGNLPHNPRTADAPAASSTDQQVPGTVTQANCYATNCSIFNGQNTAWGAYRASFAHLQVVAPTLPNTNSGTFYTAWVMDSHNGTSWSQGGWIEGNIGGNCGTPTHPTVWEQFNNNGALTTNCFTAYALGNGASYEFETYATATNGNVYCNAVYYNNAWNILGGACLAMSVQNAANSDAEAAVEYSSPTLNGAYPTDAGQTITGAEVLPNGGGWQYWDTSVGTNVVDTASQIGQYMGYNNAYYTSFHTTRTVPNFTLSASPSSMTILPGQSGSSTVVTSTNTSYDTAANVPPISYAVWGAPSGSSVSIDTSSIWPSSSETDYATVTINVGLLQLNPFTVTVRACGSVCHYTYINVTTVP
jgi:hypothetical protein